MFYKSVVKFRKRLDELDELVEKAPNDEVRAKYMRELIDLVKDNVYYHIFGKCGPAEQGMPEHEVGGRLRAGVKNVY